MKKCILRKVMTAFFICLTVPLWLLCSNAVWAEESGGRHHIENPVQSVTTESGEQLLTESDEPIIVE